MKSSRIHCYKILVCLFGLGAFNVANAQNFVTGVCTHVWQYGQSTEKVASAIKEAGATSFRDAISWQYVEKKKGEYSIPANFDSLDKLLLGAATRKLSPMLILNYGNPLYEAGGLVTTDAAREGFAKYSGWMARRYKGNVKFYEIWNEWYLGSGSTASPKTVGSVADYVKLVEIASREIKLADPDAIVLAGGTGDLNTAWFEEFARSDIFSYIDGVTIHPYNSGRKLGENTPEASLDWVDHIHQLLSKAARKSVSIYVSEIGWPTQQKGYAPSVAAAYLSRFFVLAKSIDYIKGVWWYDLLDDGADPNNREHHFGLLDLNWSDKPAAKAFRSVSDFVSTSALVSKDRTSSLIELKFRSANGERFSVHWNPIAIPGGQADLRDYGKFNFNDLIEAKRSGIVVLSQTGLLSGSENSSVPVFQKYRD